MASTNKPTKDSKAPAAARELREGKENAETDISKAVTGNGRNDWNENKPAKKKQKTSGSLTSFQKKKLNFAQYLMELLEKEDVKPILHWMDDGERICFVDTVRFAKEVMPKYFSDTKYKSFMVRMKREFFVY